MPATAPERETFISHEPARSVSIHAGSPLIDRFTYPSYFGVPFRITREAHPSMRFLYRKLRKPLAAAGAAALGLATVRSKRVMAIAGGVLLTGMMVQAAAAAHAAAAAGGGTRQALTA